MKAISTGSDRRSGKATTVIRSRGAFGSQVQILTCLAILSPTLRLFGDAAGASSIGIDRRLITS